MGATEPNRVRQDPLLVSCRESENRRSASTWRRAVERGDALRLAPGVYCRTESWFRHAPWDRYLIGAVAHALSRQEPAVFVGLTALLLRGLPTAEVPPHLEVRAGSAGRAGVARPPKLYRDGNERMQVYLGHLQNAGREFNGSFPVLPTTRRRWTSRPMSAEPESVEVRLSEGTVVGTVLCAPLLHALSEVLIHEPLMVSTAPADAVKRRHGAWATTFSERAEPLMTTTTAHRRFQAAWSFADGRAESPGESLSRATIHELGFVVPEPQRDLHDQAGRWIARVDNWWEGITLAGEFDGETKYSEALRKPGDSWQDVLVREKEREDAIRRTGAGVMRWVWKDVRNLPRFERLFVHHGVPRRAD
ncbi:hypothetical protein AB0K08_13970 [Citricoccus sp. NPDC055426]|uniref:hypothetical protein n=1 Tax=Citricoccus sp. NPDC055426 TaxID=3155536 RepID=UPI003438CFB9